MRADQPARSGNHSLWQRPRIPMGKVAITDEVYLPGFTMYRSGQTRHLLARR